MKKTKGVLLSTKLSPNIFRGRKHGPVFLFSREVCCAKFIDGLARFSVAQRASSSISKLFSPGRPKCGKHCLCHGVASIHRTVVAMAERRERLGVNRQRAVFRQPGRGLAPGQR